MERSALRSFSTTSSHVHLSSRRLCFEQSLLNSVKLKLAESHGKADTGYSQLKVALEGISFRIAINMPMKIKRRLQIPKIFELFCRMILQGNERGLDLTNCRILKTSKTQFHYLLSSVSFAMTYCSFQT